jgi:hypothetical protein
MPAARSGFGRVADFRQAEIQYLGVTPPSEFLYQLTKKTYHLLPN